MGTKEETVERNPVTEAGVIAVQLERHDDKSILLGYSIGSAKLEDGTKIEIVGSGNTLAFRVKLPEDEQSREWRCTINKVAELALDLARKEQANELAPVS